MLISSGDLHRLLDTVTEDGDWVLRRTDLVTSDQIRYFFDEYLPDPDVLTIAGARAQRSAATVTGTLALPGYDVPQSATVAFQHDDAPPGPGKAVTQLELRVTLDAAAVRCGHLRLGLDWHEALKLTRPVLVLRITDLDGTAAVTTGAHVELTHVDKPEVTFEIRASDDGLYAREVVATLNHKLSDLAGLKDLLPDLGTPKIDIPAEMAQAVESVVSTLGGLTLAEVGLRLDPVTRVPSGIWARVKITDRVQSDIGSLGLTLQDVEFVPVLAFGSGLTATLQARCLLEEVTLAASVAVPSLDFRATLDTPLTTVSDALANRLAGLDLQPTGIGSVSANGNLRDKHCTIAFAIRGADVPITTNIKLSSPSLLMGVGPGGFAIDVRGFFLLGTAEHRAPFRAAKHPHGGWTLDAGVDAPELTMTEVASIFVPEEEVPDWLDDVTVRSFQVHLEKSAGSSATGTVRIDVAARMGGLDVDAVLTVTLGTTRSLATKLVLTLPPGAGTRSMVFDINAQDNPERNLRTISGTWTADPPVEAAEVIRLVTANDQFELPAELNPSLHQVSLTHQKNTKDNATLTFLTARADAAQLTIAAL
ncbi:hypothetical protein AB8O64_35555 (plasmid) [Streptomyces sp. QH1-20]|uniref:hypothetical protein n=1 Tax=Streptomyces sp. QH1-20 TaxID=3240934 RepID=UPI003518117B